MGETGFRFVAAGGTFTAGSVGGAGASGGWAARVAQALSTKFSGLELVNRGERGSNSIRAAAQIASEAAGADLVVLEFAVCDLHLDPTLRRQSFEGCLRQVLALPSRPRVLCLFLAEPGDGTRSLVGEQKVLADHYGVPWLDARGAPGPGGWDREGPVQPNAEGHVRIAQAVVNALEPVWQRPSPAPIEPRLLRDPLYSSDWQFVRLWECRNAERRGEGGGAPWEVRVTGKVVGVLYFESELSCNLEARVDSLPEVIASAEPLQNGVEGWQFLTLTRVLGDGEHVVRVKPAAEEQTKGPASPPAIILAAGAAESGRRFRSAAEATIPLTPPALLPLLGTGRFDPAAQPGARFCWQLTRLSGRFTGPELVLSFTQVTDRNLFDIVVDGRSRVLELQAEVAQTVRIVDDLGPGEHRLEVVKRSEGLFGSAVLAGLGLAPGERWLEPPARLPYRLEVYGDSITAGACNEDGAIDQYDTLAPHDALLSYGAIAARRLGAEIVNLAVSGTGLTCSWNPILMPDVWDRTAPDPGAPLAAPDRLPHVVVVNLGQNDYGFPQSEGRPFDPEYAPRLEALVLGLRARYPEAWIVGALGGMTGWRECEPLRRLWTETFDDLQAADPRIRSFFFQAASSAHPRVDVHALLAEELVSFLAREVWPHLETPLH